MGVSRNTRVRVPTFKGNSDDQLELMTACQSRDKGERGEPLACPGPESRAALRTERRRWGLRDDG